MSIHSEIGPRLLCLFDGHCGLCNRSVQWLLKRDNWDRLRFAAFDLPAVAPLLARHGFGLADAISGPGTILVVRDAGGPAELILIRSDAVLALLAELPRPCPAIATALRWIPRPMRDLVYRLIARWRYRIWGRLTRCPLPTAKDRAHFL